MPENAQVIEIRWYFSRHKFSLSFMSELNGAVVSIIYHGGEKIHIKEVRESNKINGFDNLAIT